MRATLALLSILLASPALAAPARHHVPAEAGPECLMPGYAIERMRAAGIVAVRLDGEDAAALLDAINHTDEPTDYAAPTLVVLLRPGHVTVGMFDVCHRDDVVMTPEAFRDAYERMRVARA